MWDIDIKVLDYTLQRCRVTATRSDSGDGLEFTYACNAILETAEQRTAVLNQIKGNYLNYLNDINDSDDIIAGMEDTAKNTLNSWEATL